MAITEAAPAVEFKVGDVVAVSENADSRHIGRTGTIYYVQHALGDEGQSVASEFTFYRVEVDGAGPGMFFAAELELVYPNGE